VVADGQNGLLVEPRDARGLASAIERLLSDGAQRDSMAETGDRLVRDRFTVERMVAGTAAVYAQLGGKRHAAGTAGLSADA
jgi:glycosyltransferase involved in cell wall biosynthesis